MGNWSEVSSECASTAPPPALETALAELCYLQANLGEFVEDGHPELAHVAATIAELS
jgi:hypothetical protein